MHALGKFVFAISVVIPVHATADSSDNKEHFDAGYEFSLELPEIKVPEIPDWEDLKFPKFDDVKGWSQELTVEMGLGDVLDEVAAITPALEKLGYTVKISDIRFAPPSAKVRLRSILIDNPDTAKEEPPLGTTSQIANSLLSLARQAKRAQEYSGYNTVGIDVLYTAPSSIGLSLVVNEQEETIAPCGNP